MAASIKINADVDSSKFAAFAGLFDKFSEALHGQSTAWESLAIAAGEAGGAYKLAADQTADLSKELTDIVAKTRALEQASGGASRNWTALARSSKAAAGNIVNATESLLKWSGIAGLVSGLAAGVSPFLIASAVSGTRSAAMGSNTTYGGLQAFRTNYARFGDADSFLSRIADAQGDVSKQLPLNALGVKSEGRDASDVSLDVLDKFSEWLEKTPADVLANRMQAQQLDQLFSLEEARRMKGHRQEVTDVIGDIRRDRPQMELDAQTQRKWQDLQTQLGAAGTEIETTFVTRLVALQPGIEKLSEHFDRFVEKLLAKDGPIDHWLDKLNDGLIWLSDELDKPDTVAFVDKFPDYIAKFATSVLAFATKIGQWLGVDATDANKDAGVADPNRPAGGVGWDTPAPADMKSFGSRGIGGISGGAIQHMGRKTLGSWWTSDRIKHVYDRLKAGGLTDRAAIAAVSRWAYVEAPGGPDSANNSGGGHHGIWQADRNRWAHVGGDKSLEPQIDEILREWHEDKTEQRSLKTMNSAESDYQAAVGVSQTERAGGWDGAKDGFVNQTFQGMEHIRSVVTNVPKVTLNKNTGGNPNETAGTAGAPP